MRSANFDIYLGLGTNLGDLEANLIKAIALIKTKAPFIEIAAASSIYLTSPVGGIPQPDFLNCVILCQIQAAEISAHSNLNAGCSDTAGFGLKMLSIFKNIEEICGRKAEAIRYSSRVIDIDILYFYDNIRRKQAALNLPELKIPHPEINNRKFILLPLTELYEKLSTVKTKMPFGNKPNPFKKALENLNKSRQGLFQEISLYGSFNDDFTRIKKNKISR